MSKEHLTFWGADGCLLGGQQFVYPAIERNSPTRTILALHPEASQYYLISPSPF